jgi:hypothetical protein
MTKPSVHFSMHYCTFLDLLFPLDPPTPIPYLYTRTAQIRREADSRERQSSPNSDVQRRRRVVCSSAPSPRIVYIAKDDDVVKHITEAIAVIMARLLE